MARARNPTDEECVGCGAPPHLIFDLCAAKRFDDALNICREEIARDPATPAGYRHAAIVLELMNRHGEALPYRDKAIELAPHSTPDYFSRGDLFYEMGNYPAAIIDFSRAAEFDRDRAFGAMIFLSRADCHRRLGNYDAAIADCALVSDDFEFPGFLGLPTGSKRDLLAEIARERVGT